MKILIDFFPILLFFGTYKYYDIYVATAVLMMATVVQMGLIYAIDRKLQVMHKYVLILILVFGGLTLWLHDERFIKWKPTVFYAAMAIGLAVALWGAKKNVLRLFLGSHFELPNAVWTRLTVAWIVYCLFMAALNAYMVVSFSTAAWMNFKVWGYAFPLIFIVGQGLYIARYLKTDKA